MARSTAVVTTRLPDMDARRVTAGCLAPPRHATLAFVATWIVVCRKLISMTGQLISVGVVPVNVPGLTPVPQIRLDEIGKATDDCFVIRIPGQPESVLTARKDVVGHVWLETWPDGTNANNLSKLPECT